MITYLCPKCRGRIDVEDAFANSLITCHHCEAISEAPTRTREVIARRDPAVIPQDKIKRPTASDVNGTVKAEIERVVLLGQLRKRSAYGGTRALIGAVLGGCVILAMGAIDWTTPAAIWIAMSISAVCLANWALARVFCDLADIHLASLHRASEHYSQLEKRVEAGPVT